MKFLAVNNAQLQNFHKDVHVIPGLWGDQSLQTLCIFSGPL